MAYVYTVFGFTYKLNLSTRPKKFMGEIADWDAAEAVRLSSVFLRSLQIIQSFCLSFEKLPNVYELLRLYLIFSIILPKKRCQKF